MKIGLITPFYPYRGGVPQFGHLFYSELMKNNEVEIFSYTTLYPHILFPGKSQFVDEIEIRPDLPSQRLLSTINPFSFRKTAKAINRFAPQILIAVYWTPYQALALAQVCRKLNKNTIVVGFVHNALPHEASVFERVLGKYFFNSCHAYICMSDVVKQGLIQIVGSQKPICVLDHPIYEHYGALQNKADSTKTLGLSSNKKTLLFFGLIREYKGLDLLIEAMNLLDDSYQLVIAGESYEKFDKYTKLIEQSSAKERIYVFNQYIPDEQVALYFSVADCLILPYRSATQSGVVATAIQMQVPMVATNVGAIGLAIQKANIGIVVNEVNPQSIAKGIQDFYSSNTDYSLNLSLEKKRLSFNSFARSAQNYFEKLKNLSK